MRCKASGPKDAKILIVGEAPGSEEERLGEPFVGESGKELTQMLTEAGIQRDACRLTNVFMSRPPNNKFHLEWCRGKKEVSAAYLEIKEVLESTCPNVLWPRTYTWGSVAQGKYVIPEHLPELFRLREEICLLKPNLVVAMGGTPLWALSGRSGIMKLRGTLFESSLVPGQKVLPTYHPAFIMRAWEMRLTAIVDLIKARGEMEYPEIRRPRREVWIEPTLIDMERFYQQHIRGCELLSFDTETAHKQITCISFAPNEKIAISIPFVDKTKPGYNYWATQQEEIAAWKFVRRLLASDIPKLAQNGLYDLQYLWGAHGIPVKNFAEDTMLLHHALYIELPKDLGYLGSVYTDEAAWKIMRTRAKDEVEKKDD